jgi:O-acetyl-ADP-ribose deacetylase (regulator of RNase III)
VTYTTQARLKSNSSRKRLDQSRKLAEPKLYDELQIPLTLYLPLNMSFYEQSKRGIVSAPLSPDDKPKFEMTLQEWLGFRRNGLRPAASADRLLNELLTNSSNQNILRTSARTLFTFCARIETISCTAIVNAANESLLGGGGVDFAIHNASGPLLLRECAQFSDGCEVGGAVITKGYDLPSDFVIHTVGPILQDNGEPDDDALSRCYVSCLALCDENGIEDVVFPGISTGFYGFPWPRATKVAVDAVVGYFEEHPTSSVKVVGFCGYENEHVKLFRESFESLKSRET